MARLTIDLGTAGNSATGDSVRGAFNKVNQNFEELYLGLQRTDDNGGLLTTDVTNGDMRIQPNGTGIIEIDQLKITDDDITSLVTNGNIAITGNGTGGVTIEGVTFNGTSLSSADSTQIQINEQVDLGGNKIVNLADPTADQHAATKAYVDTQLSSSDHNFTFVGDDSTGTAVTQGETFKFAGATGITTAVSGDTLTITGTAQDFAFGSLTGTPTTLAGYGITDAVATGSTAVTVVGDDSTGTGVNIGETFKIAGGTNITTAVSGDTLTITGPDLTSYATTAYVDAQNTAQALTFVGDDSTGTAVNSGETFKIAGATGITTAVSGDTLTITGTAQDFAFGSLTGTPTTLSGYGITDAVATGSTAVTVVGDDSTGTGVNIGETFKIAGTQNITTAVSGDTLTITGPDLTSYLTTVAFADLTGKPTTLSGYGITDAASSTATAVTMVGDDSTGTAITLGETFKIAGATGITTAVSGDTLTVTGPDLSNYLQNTGTQTIDNLSFNDNIISTSSNADLNLNPGGTGRLEVTGGANVLARFNGSSLANTQTVEIDIVGPQSNGGANLGVGGSGVTDATNNLDNKAFFTADSTLDGVNIRADKSDGFVQITAGGITSSNEVARFSSTGITAQKPVTFNAGYIEAINSLTSSSTITVDFAEASVHTVTLAENTQFVVTNLPTGGTGTIIITQDGGGTNTASFGTDGSTAVKFAGGTPTLSTAGGAIDVVTIFNDGTNYLGNIAKAYA